MTTLIWRLSGELSQSKALEVENFLEEMGFMLEGGQPTLSYFEQKHTPLWKVEIFFDGKPDAQFLQNLLEHANLGQWPHHLEALPDKDWVSESQRLLHPVEAGRFFIYGNHDKDKIPANRIALHIEAGQAFGTGRHETTWCCLKLLDEAANTLTLTPKRILDLGTGSGVLAMGAQSLWPEAGILASDIDPIATDVTRENLADNGYKIRRVGTEGPGIAVLTADGLKDSAFRVEGPFDLVIANILAGPLIQMVEDIERITSHKGHILLSGLLVEQKKNVLDAYEARGLRLEGSLEKDEWAALMLTKP